MLVADSSASMSCRAAPVVKASRSRGGRAGRWCVRVFRVTLTTVAPSSSSALIDVRGRRCCGMRT